MQLTVVGQYSMASSFVRVKIPAKNSRSTMLEPPLFHSYSADGALSGIWRVSLAGDGITHCSKVLLSLMRKRHLIASSSVRAMPCHPQREPATATIHAPPVLALFSRAHPSHNPHTTRSASSLKVSHPPRRGGRSLGERTVTPPNHKLTEPPDGSMVKATGLS